MSAKNASNEVSQLFAITAAYYGRRYEDDTLKMFASDLEDFHPEDVRRALNQYRRDPKNKTMPLPAQIREILSPRLDNMALAREIAGRCVQAIKVFGWPRAQEARTFIGEEGWAVVRAHGGWTSFCENHGRTIDPTQFMAQARDRILDQINNGGARNMESLADSYINRTEGLQRRDQVLELLQSKMIEDKFKEGTHEERNSGGMDEANEPRGGSEVPTGVLGTPEPGV